VIAHTAYVPQKDPSSGRTVYIQPDYVAHLLSTISRANHTVLSKLQLQLTHELPIPVQSNMSLSRFADLGANDPDIAWPIFNALWAELTIPKTDCKPDQARPPILFALDDLAHVMRDSFYRDPDFKLIHAHDLVLVDKYMRLLSGQEQLPNGGMILAADSASNRPSVPTLDFALDRSAAAMKARERASRQIEGGEENEDDAGLPELPSWNPYKAADERVMKVMDTFAAEDIQRIGGMDRVECRGIMEYYARSGMLRQQVNDRLVGEKWTIAGGGIVGEVERGTVMMRF